MKNHQGISLLYIRIDQENIFFVAETAVTVATDCKYEWVTGEEVIYDTINKETKQSRTMPFYVKD